MRTNALRKDFLPIVNYVSRNNFLLFHCPYALYIALLGLGRFDPTYTMIYSVYYQEYTNYKLLYRQLIAKILKELHLCVAMI